MQLAGLRVGFCFRIYGLGFMVGGLGFKFGFMVWGLGFGAKNVSRWV